MTLTLRQGPGDGAGPVDTWTQRPIDMGRLLIILWHRKWLMALCFGAAIAVAQAMLSNMPKTYTAHAEVMLNNRETTVVDIETVVSELGGLDASTNEERVLTSEALLQRVVDRLRLDLDPEFNRSLAPASLLSDWKGAVNAALSDGPLAPVLVAAPDVPDPALSREHRRVAIVGAVRARLKVEAIPKTRAISIEVTSTDPAKAALIANTLADLYIVDQLDAKFESTRRASAWLADRMSALKNKVEASEAAVEAFKADQAIGSGQGVDLTTQQIAELNIELIAARAVTAEAAARYSQIKRRSSTGGVAAAADIVSSELVLRLRTGLAELLRKQAELSNRYGEKHPTMTTLRAEIADTREAVSAEVGKIVERLANDVAVARAREAALQRSLTELEDRSVELSKSSVALRQLEREADADRLIYETFLNRFRETSAQEDLQSADARLLSAASPPLAPSGPNSKKVLVVASVLGLSLGIALVMLLESMDRTYRTARELSEATGLPVLASLPRHRKGRRRGQLLDYVRRKPKSALAEAVRAMRTGLYLTNIDTPPRVVMITSSGPGEGKTTAGLMLAQQAACAGHTVIVVDCDVRRPTLHTTFKLPGRPGLLPVLLGTADLEQAVQQDLPTGLDLLPAAQSIAEAAEIFTSDRFAELVADLRSRYDLVVLDAPPALLVSDAATIGRLADAVVYAVRWNDTPHGPVEEGLAHLRQMGIDVAGSILTLVDRSAEARFAEAAYGAGRGFYAARNAYYAD